MTRRQRQIERLGGIPDTSPSPDTEIGVLEPTEDNEIDEKIEVVATFKWSDGRISDQTLEAYGVESDEDLEVTDEIRYAATDQLDRYEF